MDVPLQNVGPLGTQPPKSFVKQTQNATHTAKSFDKIHHSATLTRRMCGRGGCLFVNWLVDLIPFRMKLNQ
jgi:hypothetical protein